jgi:hypothetical protein
VNRCDDVADNESAVRMLKPGAGAAGFDASVKAAKNSTGGAFTLIESHMLNLSREF